jgi:hypothetical protein
MPAPLAIPSRLSAFLRTTSPIASTTPPRRRCRSSSPSSAERSSLAWRSRATSSDEPRMVMRSRCSESRPFSCSSRPSLRSRPRLIRASRTPSYRPRDRDGPLVSLVARLAVAGGWNQALLRENFAGEALAAQDRVARDHRGDVHAGRRCGRARCGPAPARHHGPAERRGAGVRGLRVSEWPSGRLRRSTRRAKLATLASRRRGEAKGLCTYPFDQVGLCIARPGPFHRGRWPMVRRAGQNRVRYAVVGAGNIAQVAVLPAFAHAKETSELAVIVSDDAEKRAALGERYRVKTAAYADFEAVISSERIDAVYIALGRRPHHGSPTPLRPHRRTRPPRPLRPRPPPRARGRHPEAAGPRARSRQRPLPDPLAATTRHQERARERERDQPQRAQRAQSLVPKNREGTRASNPLLPLRPLRPISLITQDRAPRTPSYLCALCALCG